MMTVQPSSSLTHVSKPDGLWISLGALHLRVVLEEDEAIVITPFHGETKREEELTISGDVFSLRVSGDEQGIFLRDGDLLIEIEDIEGDLVVAAYDVSTDEQLAGMILSKDGGFVIDDFEEDEPDELDDLDDLELIAFHRSLLQIEQGLEDDAPIA